MLKERDGAEFTLKAKKFHKAVLAHIDEEENKAFPRLQENADPEDTEDLTRSVKAFRKSLHFELPRT